VSTAGPAGSVAYQVDASASEIWLFLHADGPLAKVGHTHVITTQAMQGTVWLHPKPELSGCHLQLPVASFVVDDPKERAAAGAEFSEPLDESARSGTRDHMLGDRQLDAAHYPQLTLQCRNLATTAAGTTLEVAATVRDRTTVLNFPVRWHQQGNTVEGEGELSFTQSSLGLEPYSLMLGALRVADPIRARFRIVARVAAG
jgi:polyisoprenoid-binding protein YceI